MQSALEGSGAEPQVAGRRFEIQSSAAELLPECAQDLLGHRVGLGQFPQDGLGVLIEIAIELFISRGNRPIEIVVG